MYDKRKKFAHLCIYACVDKYTLMPHKNRQIEKSIGNAVHAHTEDAAWQTFDSCVESLCQWVRWQERDCACGLAYLAFTAKTPLLL